jgi:hypothetical protein
MGIVAAYRGTEVRTMPKHIVQETIENAGYQTRSYSGRGMYGKICVGVDAGKSLGAFFADILQEVRNSSDKPGGEEMDSQLIELEDAFRTMSSDAMGMGTIVYFPDVPFMGDDEEDVA